MSAQPQPEPQSETPPDLPVLSVFNGDADSSAAEVAGGLPLDAQNVELGELLEAWNAATQRLEMTHATLQAEVARLSDELEVKNRELSRKNRLADLGQMASHVAHEVRNNLSPVTLYLSLLRRRLAGDAAALETLSKVESGFTALEATVNDLLSFTAHRQPNWQRFVVGDLVEEVCESMAPQLEAQGVEVDLDVPPNTLLEADRELVRRAVLNLVINALDVMPDGGDLVVTSYDSAEAFELEIADSGPGLTEEQSKKLFEPFFTTKDRGTGLGLSVVRHVAEAHGGSVNATNCPEGGAAFTLTFPRRGTMKAAA